MNRAVLHDLDLSTGIPASRSNAMEASRFNLSSHSVPEECLRAGFVMHDGAACHDKNDQTNHKHRHEA